MHKCDYKCYFFLSKYASLFITNHRMIIGTGIGNYVKKKKKSNKRSISITISVSYSFLKINIIIIYLLGILKFQRD